MSSTRHESIALKEWAVSVKALAEGEQLILVRKGGIREERKEFVVEHPSFWLYPTYEHQREDLLKPAYVSDLQAVMRSRGGSGLLDISLWAQVVEDFKITETALVDALSPHYIFTNDYAQERLHWRPKKPLHILLLRVYRLAQPVSVAVLPEYGGCSSWVTLREPIPLRGLTPVLADGEFARRADEIRATLGAPVAS